MNCERTERLISRQRDGDLRPRDQRRLDAHLAGCAACRAFAAQVAGLGVALRARPEPAGPTPEAAWAGVQRAIRLAEAGAGRLAPESLWQAQPWLRWASAAALVVLVAGGGLLWHGGAAHGPVDDSAAKVLRVTTELAGASTMVYEDHDTGMAVVWVVPAEDGNHAL